MTVILQFLSSTLATKTRADDRPGGAGDQQRETWPCEHEGDLPAARDADAWIRTDMIRTGRLA